MNQVHENQDGPLRSLVDWVQFTLRHKELDDGIKQLDVNDVCQLLGIGREEFFEAPGGLHGYTKQLLAGDIRILYAGAANMGIHVHMSGQGCREYETYYGADWETLFERVINEYGGAFTRLDLAIDEIRYNDERPYWTVPQLIRKTKKAECRSKFRTAHRMEKIRITDGSSDGHTIYYGSVKSDIQARVYQKDKERANAGKELEEHLTTWNRLELQLSDDRATDTARAIISGRSSGDIVFGLLRNYLNFVQPNGDSNRGRWPICEWWLEYLQDAERLSLCKRAPDKTIEQKQEWFDRQILPSFAELWAAAGSPGEDYFVDLIERGLENMDMRKYDNALHHVTKQNELAEARKARSIHRLSEYMEYQEQYRKEVASGLEGNKKETIAGNDDPPKNDQPD